MGIGKGGPPFFKFDVDKYEKPENIKEEYQQRAYQTQQ